MIHSGSPVLSAISTPSFSASHSTKETPITRSRCCGEGCKKKLSLTDFPCKCKKIFCSMHRPAEDHSCTYDYKAGYNKELLKTMQEAVVARRVDII